MEEDFKWKQMGFSDLEHYKGWLFMNNETTLFDEIETIFPESGQQLDKKVAGGEETLEHLRNTGEVVYEAI